MIIIRELIAGVPAGFNDLRRGVSPLISPTLLFPASAPKLVDAKMWSSEVKCQ